MQTWGGYNEYFAFREMNKNKRRGDFEERRIAEKLTMQTGMNFKRQVLSGAAGRFHNNLKGDIVCCDENMKCRPLIEVKYRRNLGEKSVFRGCKMISEFIWDISSRLPSLLIVITGGGVNYRRKGYKKDWLFARKSHVNSCDALAGHHWLGESCHYPFLTYKPIESWVFTSLDEVLKIEGSKDLFIG